ncbi:DNA cytosine methyltransferase [Listeria seeligeri]|uniref:DNA cytosine methyltransferase n=1 Tax=Listeria seeligeri TaxID=1640 RepID=UPI001624A8EF|nr:DNA cytosine methyltransferase [Listeria seeligeri]MBC1421928.1 DNA cytosine methyltransferase [Listeria seeligeri]MBC1424745.1 DNA cytosine methyltransferase [Listeria seeligeri]MBC1752036.1 DNA cytosine methyltransferase [Listeria seeligeri]MBC1830227.1 DNA cytosine methyltransferase [Listeria seeligeri]MBC1844456.1 DNA cytosine methyltransferase [Listeria seeligeri]
MKVVDLFSGAGGLSLGFERAGFDIVAAYEYWDKAVEIYKKNFKHIVHETDLSDFNNYDEIKSYHPDIIIGGPPCQDYSSAGLRNESLGRADLTIKYAEIIQNVLPNFFVMENVALVEKSNAFQKAKKMLIDSDYGITSIVLDASRCGVPQKRKRFFMIGELHGTDGSITENLTRNLSTSPMTVKDYLGDSINIEHYYRHPRNYNRRGIFSVHEPAPTIRGVNRPVPEGYKGHSADSAPLNANLRALTTMERSYLQTFPEGFFNNTLPKTHLEQMIGNAVPVEMAHFVGNALMDYLKEKE